MLFKKKKTIEQLEVEAILRARMLLRSENSDFKKATERDPFWRETFGELADQSYISKIECSQQLIDSYNSSDGYYGDHWMEHDIVEHFYSDLLVAALEYRPKSDSFVNILAGVTYEVSLFEGLEKAELEKVFKWGREIAGLRAITMGSYGQNHAQFIFDEKDGYPKSSESCRCPASAEYVLDRLTDEIKERAQKIFFFKSAERSSSTLDAMAYSEGLPNNYTVTCTLNNEYFVDTLIIQPNGELRSPNFFIRKNGEIMDTYSCEVAHLPMNNGTKFWSQILPTDLVIRFKATQVSQAEESATYIRFDYDVIVIPKEVTKEATKTLENLAYSILENVVWNEKGLLTNYVKGNSNYEKLYRWSLPYSHSFKIDTGDLRLIPDSVKLRMPEYFYKEGMLMAGDPSEDLPEEVFNKEQMIGKPVKISAFAKNLTEDDDDE